MSDQTKLTDAELLAGEICEAGDMDADSWRKFAAEKTANTARELSDEREAVRELLG